ncbi:XdhC family protein [Hymenobacter humi]|uniref:XdhC family protein n=1 Tax=Hymenobacter humi TaxID=1411620 RepID=A0ABW2UCE3_9BACT
MPASPRDLPVWALAAASLRAGVPVALLCVVSSAGSSPGRQGFKMSVTAAETAGSIGGGIMEHKFIELARQRLHAGEFGPVLRPQVHRREAPTDRSGMMCSGEQEVLLWPLTIGDLPVVAAIEKALLADIWGQLLLSIESGLQLLSEASPGGAASLSGAPFYEYQSGPGWQYREQAGLSRPRHHCGRRACEPGFVPSPVAARF